MSYTPPLGNAVAFEFSAGAYVAPVGSAVTFDFGVPLDGLMPAGIYEFAMGLPTVGTNLRPVGVDWSAFGTPAIANTQLFIRPSGVASAEAFGVASVLDPRRYVTPAGSSFGAFGAATVLDPRQYVAPAGSSFGAFGTAILYNHTQLVSATGAAWTSFGAPSLQNLNRTIYAQRIDTPDMGEPYLIGPRYITASVGDTSLFGLPVTVGPRTSRIEGFDTASYGVNIVSNSTRTVRPYDIESPYHQVSLGAAVNDFTRYIFPTGMDEQEFFGPVTGIAPFSVIEAPSFDGSDVGAPTVAGSGADRRIRASGIAAGAFGAARTNPAAITGIGFSAAAIGVANVSNYTRYLTADGFSAARYGTAWVSNYRRYVDVQGFEKSVVWDDFGPIDESGRAARVYLSDPTTTVESFGFTDWGVGAASVRQTYGC